MDKWMNRWISNRWGIRSAVKEHRKQLIARVEVSQR